MPRNQKDTLTEQRPSSRNLRVLKQLFTFMRPYRGALLGAVLALLVAAMAVLYARLPGAFLPDEDQGSMIVQVITPTGATQQRTMKSLEAVERHFLEDEKDTVASIFTVQGFSFSGSGQNTGMGFVRLRDWSERDTPGQHVKAVARRAMGALGRIKDAFAFAFVPPAVTELGRAAGFSFHLQDRAGQGHDALLAARNQLLGAAGGSKLLVNVRPNGQDDTPQLRIRVDNQKAAALGLRISDINATLSTAWGGRYIDDFIDRGRVKRVYLQADAPWRMNPEDLRLWSVRNDHGEMVPFSSFADWEWDYGSPRLERFNGVPSVEIQGESAPGVSTGEAMAEVERLVAALPAGFGIEWAGVSYQEREAGAQTPLLFTLSLAIVFLCLAALYESWSIPTAVLMVAPLGILGAALANTLLGMQRDVYFQVAMLVTVGLTSKNAILIVEVGRELRAHGTPILEAAVEASLRRLRPILMTSFAFILGVVPLAVASGAGAASRRAMGTAVIGGMLASTFVAILFVPVYFVLMQRLSERLRKRKKQVSEPVAQDASS